MLAIAALIFLMIFVALPALQRGQRDTARKEDVGAVASALNTFRSNNSGSFSAISSSQTNFQNNFVSKYIDKLSQYDATNVRLSTSLTSDPGNNILVSFGAKCATDGSGDAESSTNNRLAAVRVKLENAQVAYCQEI